MDKESKSGPGQFSGNGVIAVVLLAAGVLFVRQAPLETTRPPVNEARLEQRVALQDVDARLWQDPFSVIAKARAEARKKQPDKADEEERRHRSTESLVADIRSRMKAKTEEDFYRRETAEPGGAIVRRTQRVEILAVMLPGGPHPENVESRRRARYAVLAGLNASRLAPVDTEHLGYFLTRPGRDPATPPTAPEPAATPVPFEWFEPAADVRRRESVALGPLVLVMWLQSEAFDIEPLRRMRDLVLRFALPDVSWRVLGPNGSDGLKAMIDEAAARRFAENTDMSGLPLRFYSPYATVPDNVLLDDWFDPGAAPSLTKFFARKHVKLVRTIGDDASLAKSLIGELALRGLAPQPLAVDPGQGRVADDRELYRQTCDQPRTDGNAASPSHIAVVAEWDTLYGRSMTREFRATQGERGFCVRRFNYVRGLDGQLPANGEGASAPAGAAKPAQSDKDAGRRKDGTFIESAEGQSQFDYLRRLAKHIRAQDLEIRQSSADGHGLRAIGVLGNDVHDKLLVLQALRTEFPNVIFFTTDMDARFLHPREQAWTRNLIVASSFGLRLTDGVQGGAPPFRAGYQTSTFLSTRLAMEDARRASEFVAGSEKARPLPASHLDKWFQIPRVFEIGRTEAFGFAGRAAEKDSTDQGAPADGVAQAGLGLSDDEAAWLRGQRECRGPEWAQCLDIHPPRSPRYPVPGTPMLAWIFSLAILALWLPVVAVNRSARRAMSKFYAARATLAPLLARCAAAAALLALLQLVLPLWLAGRWASFAKWLTGDEPLVAFEGISLWPTEGIRLFTLLLCGYLLYRGWLMLSYNLDDITEKFSSGRTRREIEREQAEKDKDLDWWQRLGQMFSFGFPGPSDRPPASAHNMQPKAVDYWHRHIVQNRLGARFARTAACVALALLVSYLLMLAVGEHRFVPQRGDRALAVHEWLRYPALVMMYFLVFSVVDATVYCVCFVRGLRKLREHEANWPASTLELFEAQLGVHRSHLDNWVDLQFVALRTRCVTRLIYYPFIVISLWLLSKSTSFDRWTLTFDTLAPAALGALVALVCALALRVTAEKSREHALNRIRNAVMRANVKAGAATPTFRRDRPVSPVAEQPTSRQLELLQARIENLREGAFAPFWQQPLLKAVLLPFATLGGTTLLDYMALANI